MRACCGISIVLSLCCAFRNTFLKQGIIKVMSTRVFENWKVKVTIIFGLFFCVFKIDVQMNNSKDLLSEQETPKNPSLQTQMKVSTLTSTHVAPLSQGELSQAAHGAGN